MLTNTGGIACALAGRLDDAVDRMHRAAELHLLNGNLGGAGIARMKHRLRTIRPEPVRPGAGRVSHRPRPAREG